MGLRTVLDTSSGHLSPATWAWLDEQLSDAVLRDPLNAAAAQVAGGKTRYGWLVYAPEGVAAGLPDDLTTILLRAREQGAEYVLFDCDAPPASGLPMRHPDFLDGSDPA
jgi:hemolysin-activating ACP:hemolysin acyltransferase